MLRILCWFGFHCFRDDWTYFFNDYEELEEAKCVRCGKIRWREFQ
jgi:hypothetical protein